MPLQVLDAQSADEDVSLIVDTEGIGARHNVGVTVSFEGRTIINAPVETVYDLSLDVDANVQSQARSRKHTIAGVTSATIGLGEQVTWRAVYIGIPFRLTSRVTELDRPYRFVDELIDERGAFLEQLVEKRSVDE